MHTKSKTNIINLRDLRENTQKYIDQVHGGASLLVMRRSTPIFRLSSVDSTELGWESVADFTTVDEKGVSARTLLKKLRALNG